MAVTPRDQLDEIEDTLKAALTGMPDAPPLQDLIATITGMVEPSLAAGDIGAVVKALRLRTLAGVFHLGFDIDRGRNAARLSRACALLNLVLDQPPGRDHTWLGCEQAKTFALRGAILDRNHQDRKASGMSAAHGLYSRAADRFVGLGLLGDAARQYANAATVSFRLGRLAAHGHFGRAIAEFDIALSFRDDSLSLSERSSWLASRAAALSELAIEDPLRFTEACAAFEDVLAAPAVLTRKVLASSLMNFAGLLLASGRPSARVDILRAHDLLAEALALAEDDLLPSIHLSLAHAWIVHPGHALTGNIERAIEYGELALAAFDDASEPGEAARAAHVLAEAWAMRISGDRISNAERARDLAARAVTAARRAGNLSLLAMTLASVGQVEMYHAQETEGWLASAANLRESILVSAASGGDPSAAQVTLGHVLLSLHAATGDPAVLSEAEIVAERALERLEYGPRGDWRRRAILLLGRCAGEAGDWHRASKLFDDANAISSDTELGHVGSITGLARMLGSTAEGFQLAGFARWQCGDALGAWQRLAQGKGRALSAYLGMPDDPQVVLNDLEAHEVVVAPLFVPNHALLLVADRPAGTLRLRGIPIAGESQATLQRHLFGGDGAQGWAQHLEETTIRSHLTRFDATLRWMKAGLVAALERWSDQEARHEGLMLYLMAGSTSILPWRAALQGHSTWQLLQLPTLRVTRNEQRHASRMLLVIEDPSRTLAIAPPLCRTVSAQWPGPVAYPDGSTLGAADVSRRAAEAGDVLFFGHSAFDPMHPEQSALLLADNNLLSVDAIARFALKRRPRVCLAGCESGVVDVAERSDEAMGLATAWLTAGAELVVGAQWRVAASASALLVAGYYERLSEGVPSLEALDAASRHVAGLSLADACAVFERLAMPVDDLLIAADLSGTPDRPFSHPFFWSGYTAFGLIGAARVPAHERD